MNHTLDKTTCIGFTDEEFEKFKTRYDTDKYNQRMILIARIFEYDKFLGVDVKQLKRNPNYYNDQFDYLYDMNFYELEEFEQKMHELVTTFGQVLNKNYRK